MTASLRWIGASLLACAVALTGPGVRPADACHSDEDEAAEAEREAAEEAREAAREAAEAEREAAAEAAEAEREAAREAAEAEREAAAEAAGCRDCDHGEDEDETIEVEAEVGFDSDRIDQLLEQVNRLLETQLDQLLDRLGDLESGGASVWMEVELD